MEKREFFERWYDSYMITRATIECFPEPALSQRVVNGLRAPGELYAHIFAHVNGLYNACVRRELITEELYLLPEGVDLGKTAALVRYGQRTMEELLAHGSVDERTWQQRIKTSWGEIPMENLCLDSFAHEVHHRGQLFTMLRLLGVNPPAFCRHERSPAKHA